MVSDSIVPLSAAVSWTICVYSDDFGPKPVYLLQPVGATYYHKHQRDAKTWTYIVKRGGSDSGKKPEPQGKIRQKPERNMASQAGKPADFIYLYFIFQIQYNSI